VQDSGYLGPNFPTPTLGEHSPRGTALVASSYNYPLEKQTEQNRTNRTGTGFDLQPQDETQNRQ